MPKTNKFSRLKEGEVKLLFAIWNIQRRENFPRGVSRKEILAECGWKTDNQFYGFYNDLRQKSKTHYIKQDKKLYYLAENNLVTKSDTARVLCMMRDFAKEQEEICPDRQIPGDEFTKWAAEKLHFAPNTIRDKLQQAVSKQYLIKIEREPDKFYFQPLERMTHEEEWLQSMCQTFETAKVATN